MEIRKTASSCAPIMADVGFNIFGLPRLQTEAKVTAREVREGSGARCFSQCAWSGIHGGKMPQLAKRPHPSSSFRQFSMKIKNEMKWGIYTTKARFPHPYRRVGYRHSGEVVAIFPIIRANIFPTPILRS